MELFQALEQRYSVRSFSDQVPTKEQIEAVLEAGRLAPTAKNLQPQRLYVATKPEHLAAIDQATRCRYNAPVCIVVGYDTQEAIDHAMFAQDQPWSFGDLDATSVLMHMMLRATDLGMGTCWLGAYVEEPLRTTLGIPENVAIRAIIDLGFAAEDGTPSPRHTLRKPLEETVTWL